MLPFYVYILKCSDSSLYTGHTDDLEKRFSEHMTCAMPNSYTSTRLPVELVYADTFPTRDEAQAAVYQIKNWSRKKKDALIIRNWDKLITLSKKIF